jgi:hypothetical protein
MSDDKKQEVSSRNFLKKIYFFVKKYSNIIAVIISLIFFIMSCKSPSQDFIIESFEVYNKHDKVYKLLLEKAEKKDFEKATGLKLDNASDYSFNALKKSYSNNWSSWGFSIKSYHDNLKENK